VTSAVIWAICLAPVLWLIFRFREDGLSERSYAIVEVGEEGTKPVSPARRSFDAPRAEARLGTLAPTN